MTASVVAEAGLVPTEFVTGTVKVEATSLGNPETVIGDEVLVAVEESYRQYKLSHTQ